MSMLYVLMHCLSIAPDVFWYGEEVRVCTVQFWGLWFVSFEQGILAIFDCLHQQMNLTYHTHWVYCDGNWCVCRYISLYVLVYNVPWKTCPLCLHDNWTVQYGNVNWSTSTGVKERHNCARRQYGFTAGPRWGFSNFGFAATTLSCIFCGGPSHGWLSLNIEFPNIKVCLLVFLQQVSVAMKCEDLDGMDRQTDS
jgi:hypothetical protein